MVCWYRLNQSKLRHASSYIKSWYGQSFYASTHDCATSCAFMGAKPAPFADIWRGPTDFCSNVRFFAAPVQAKPKEEAKGSNAPCLNEKITAKIVRVVTDEGHFVVSIHEALERARKLNLDLVEVQKNANPPVCKIMDFHKEKYIQQLRDKDRAKSQSAVTLRKGDCKEVRFKGKTEQKDLQTKADMVKRLMERGYRVRCRAMGTEDQDLGGLLSRLSALIEDVAVVESGPRVEKEQAYVIVRHAKFGPPKKGKKLSGDMKQDMAAQPGGDFEDEDLGEKGLESEKGGDFEDEDLGEERLESEKEILSDIRNAAGRYAGWSTGGANYRPGRAPSSSNPNYTVNIGEPSTETENRYARGGSPGRTPTSSNPNYTVNIGEPSTETENRYARGGSPGRTPSSSNPNYTVNIGEPSTETENRYARGGANNRFAQSRGQGARDSHGLQPEVPRKQEVPNQRRQEVPYQRGQTTPDTHTSHLTGESKKAETPPCPSRSSFGLFSSQQSR